MNDVMGKWLVATYSVGQVLLLRSVAALAVLLPLMRRQKVRLEIPPQPGLHLVRIVLSTLEVACFYWAVTYLPLADVMTYYLAGPIYVAAFAVFWLGERLDRQRVAAIGIGFVGVLIALRPSPATMSLPALIALAGSIFYALLMITTRKLRDTHDATLVLGQIIGTLIFGLAAAPFAWVTPGPQDRPGLHRRALSVHADRLGSGAGLPVLRRRGSVLDAHRRHRDLRRRSRAPAPGARGGAAREGRGGPDPAGGVNRPPQMLPEWRLTQPEAEGSMMQ
jgi:hypothetical protein